MPGKIKRTSVGNLHKPGTKSLRFSQPGQLFVSFNESFLRNIRGGMIIAKYAQCHGTNQPLVTSYKYGKSLFFATKNSVYQSSICSHVGTFPYRSASIIKEQVRGKNATRKLFSADIIIATFTLRP